MGNLFMWEGGHGRDQSCGLWFSVGSRTHCRGKHHLVAQSQTYHAGGLNSTTTIVVLNAIIRKVACLLMKTALCSQLSHIGDDTLHIKYYARKVRELTNEHNLKPALSPKE